MKRNPRELLEVGMANIKLDILVFGPSVKIMSSNEKVRNLQNKRIDIRNELDKLGHNVAFAEDVVDSEMDDPHNNAFVQELLIMADYDMIVNIVDSPGSIMEASVPAKNTSIAQKTTLFLNAEYKEGLVLKACLTAEYLGACFKDYSYPEDLVECHLLGAVMDRVRKAQTIKLLSAS